MNSDKRVWTMSLIQRAYRSYQRGGMAALAHGVKWRSERLMRRLHWSRWGGLSVVLANSLRPLSPPVLILSLPRSGSSWTGDTLGQAIDAMYLREPFTQSRVNDDRLTYHPEWNFDLTPDRLTADYWRLTQDAFAGLPRFSRKIVRYPKQWGFIGRTQRRLVIKEVQSLTNVWLVQRYRPRVIFLVRHPAAVALSYQKFGWGQFATLEDWREHGERQARVQRFILDQLDAYPDKRYVEYETLCADPVSQFQELFRFAQLKWTAALERLILERNTDEGSDQDRNPYRLKRNSARMIDSWRSKIDEAALRALQAGYSAYPLPWYRSQADWKI